MILGCTENLEATTEVVYSQSIDSCSIFKIILPLVKNVSICDLKITCPILNEDSKFKLIDSSNNNTKLSEINALRVKNCKIFYLPQFYEFGENLKFLSIFSSGLRKITQDNLRDLTNLISLDLGGNKIQTLKEGTFMYTTKMKAIRLSRNPIAFIAPRVFESLNYLELLELVSIKCYTGTINTTDSVEMSQALTNLTLSCNNKTFETLNKPEDCSKAILLERSDYFDDSDVLTSKSKSSNVDEDTTEAVNHTQAMALSILNLTIILINLIVLLVALCISFKSQEP